MRMFLFLQLDVCYSKRITTVSQTQFSQKSNVKRENVIYAPCSLSVVLRVLTDAELITFCNCFDRAIDSIIYNARSMLTRLFTDITEIRIMKKMS